MDKELYEESGMTGWGKTERSARTMLAHNLRGKKVVKGLSTERRVIQLPSMITER